MSFLKNSKTRNDNFTLPFETTIFGPEQSTISVQCGFARHLELGGKGEAERKRRRKYAGGSKTEGTCKQHACTGSLLGSETVSGALLRSVDIDFSDDFSRHCARVDFLASFRESTFQFFVRVPEDFPEYFPGTFQGCGKWTDLWCQ